ncbi:MAG: hypothetical protein QOI65_644 [Thermoleophilaceae bacterium]|nr:hypothetical protein [Thermoleophilaceae bacterium]
MASGSDAASFETSARAYDRHVGRYGAALAAELVDFAGVRPGARALDVGCGPGALTAALVDRVGAGSVAAVDRSASFVAACRQRLPGVDVRIGSAERLPFADGEFDFALSQLVVNFLDDARAGVTDMRRVTGDGGVVAACVWDYTGGMTMLRAFWDAALAVDPERAGELDEGRRMRYCRPDELATLWEAAGLVEVESVPIVVGAKYENFDDFWSPLPLGVGPSGAYCASLDAATREALRAECRRRLGSPSGPFELSARAWAVHGRAPYAKRPWM